MAIIKGPSELLPQRGTNQTIVDLVRQRGKKDWKVGLAIGDKLDNVFKCTNRRDIEFLQSSILKIDPALTKIIPKATLH